MEKFTYNEKQIIYELLLSLNKGDCRAAEERVAIAIKQLKQLEEAGVLKGANYEH